MAVGPFRALLVAQAQASYNRALRELGRGGVLAALLVVGLLVFTVLVPVGLGSAVLGYWLGRRGSVTGLGLLLTVSSPVAGVLSAVAGGRRQLAWESQGALPARLSSLFAAELVAGLTDGWNLLFASSLLAVCLGVVVAEPLLAGWVALGFSALLLVLLSTPLLLLTLASGLVRRLRWVVGGLVLLAALSTALVPRAFYARAPRPPSAEVAEQRRQRLHELREQTADVVRWLPGGAVARSLERARAGDLAGAARAQLYPLGLAAALLAACLWLLRREARPAASTPAGQGGRRLWSVRSAPHGVARLQWRNILGSTAGRFAMLVPLFSLFFIFGPLAGMGVPSGWVLPAALAYASLGGATFHFNQFGLDGHGVKALLLLPIAPEDLLRGKAHAAWTLQAVSGALLLVLVAVFRRVHVADAAAAGCYLVCLCAAQNAVGQWTSAWLPRRIVPKAMNNRPLPAVVAWISLAVLVTVGGTVGTVYAVLTTYAPFWSLPAMAVLAVGFSVANLRLRPLAAAYLDGRREALLDALG